jgi:hypothetical protein
MDRVKQQLQELSSRTSGQHGRRHWPIRSIRLPARYLMTKSLTDEDVQEIEEIRAEKAVAW